MSNNSLNNQTYDADFTANRQAASAGTTCFIAAVHNDAVNAGSSAQVVAQSQAASGADAYHVSALASTRAWCHGIDASDAGALKETTFAGGSTSPSTGTLTRKVTTAGEQTMPLQPAFLAALTVGTGGVTGFSTNYILGNNGGGTTTVYFDQGSDVTFPGGNLTFTAPVTGKYYFHVNFVIGNLLVANNSSTIQIITTPRSFAGSTVNPFVAAVGGVFCHDNSCFVDLTAGDTVTFLLGVIGGAADTVTVQGTPAPNAFTYAEGYLVC